MSKYVDEILRVPRLKEEEAIELVALMMMGHEVARDILITHYLQCAFYIACKYQDRAKQPMEDMIGIGSEAVIRAIDNYKANSNATVQTVVYTYLRKHYAKYIEYNHAQQRDYSGDVSLQEPIFDEGPEFSSSLPCQEECLDVGLLDEELNKLIMELLEKASPKDKDMILWRYGFCDGKPHTLKETGKRLNLSPQRIEQREKRALGKLREAAKKKGLNY